MTSGLTSKSYFLLRNTELGNLAENLEINVPPVTVSYVREDDQKLMEGIQQLLNRLNGGNVEITDQMVKDALALIKENFQNWRPTIGGGLWSVI